MEKMLNRCMRLLTAIQKRRPVDQATLARDLGMGLMTVNTTVNQLLRFGLIVKAGKSNSRSGRKSDLYKLNTERYAAIGMALNEERALLSTVRSDGGVISHVEYPFTVHKETIVSAEKLLGIITKYYRKFIEETSVDSSTVAVLGIALEGIVDTENGRFILGTHLGGIIDLQLRDHLSALIDIPVYIDDPCRAAAYYESKFVPELTDKNFISIYIGKGVGSGIVINGEVYRGFTGIAGEVGHMVVTDNGIRCKCGNYGCLETIASEENIIRQIKEGIREGVFTKILSYCDSDINRVDMDILKRAADDGDKFSLNIIEHVGNHFGKALALLVNILNPEYIVIGGEGVRIGSYLENYASRIINTNALNVIEKKTRIMVSEYDKFKDSKCIAIEAFDSLFENHGHERETIVKRDLMKMVRSLR
jgi:N-acetylglucosamine repressor